MVRERGSITGFEGLRLMTRYFISLNATRLLQLNKSDESRPETATKIRRPSLIEVVDECTGANLSRTPAHHWLGSIVAKLGLGQQFSRSADSQARPESVI